MKKILIVIGICFLLLAFLSQDAHALYIKFGDLFRSLRRPRMQSTYYDDSGRLESQTLSRPDDSGVIYYHYLNEEGGQVDGQGRVDVEVLADPDENGATAYTYEYTDDGYIRYSYTNVDTSDPSNPLIPSNPIATETFDLSGNLIHSNHSTYYEDTGSLESRTLDTPDDDGAIYYHYTNENPQDPGSLQVDVQVLLEPDENGAIAYEYVYPAEFSDVAIDFDSQNTDTILNNFDYVDDASRYSVLGDEPQYNSYYYSLAARYAERGGSTDSLIFRPGDYMGNGQYEGRTLRKTVTIGEGGGSVSFWWRMTGWYDNFDFNVYDENGNLVSGACSSISSHTGTRRTMDWTFNEVNLPEGTYTLEWTYDSIENAYPEPMLGGFVDDIVITNALNEGYEINAYGEALLTDPSNPVLSDPISTNTYNGNGVLIGEENFVESAPLLEVQNGSGYYTYYENTGLLESATLTNPDMQGAIYYNYTNTALSQRVNVQVLDEPDGNGARAYAYEYVDAREAGISVPGALTSIVGGKTLHFVGFSGGYENISDAIDAANTGDVIIVKEGTYNENITLKDGISLLGGFNEAGERNIDIYQTTINGLVAAAGIEDAELNGFTVREGGSPGELTIGGVTYTDLGFLPISIVLSDSANIRILNNTIEDSVRGIFVMDSEDVSIFNNELCNNAYHMLAQGSNLRVENNIMHDASIISVNEIGGDSIYNNNVLWNASTHFVFQDGNIVVRNNTVEASYTGINSSGANVTSENNIFYGIRTQYEGGTPSVNSGNVYNDFSEVIDAAGGVYTYRNNPGVGYSPLNGVDDLNIMGYTRSAYPDADITDPSNPVMIGNVIYSETYELNGSRESATVIGSPPTIPPAALGGTAGGSPEPVIGGDPSDQERLDVLPQNTPQTKENVTFSSNMAKPQGGRLFLKGGDLLKGLALRWKR